MSQATCFSSSCRCCKLKTIIVTQ